MTALELTARMLHARETVRRLYGEEYPEKIAKWRTVARAAAKQQACSMLEVPLRCAGMFDGQAMVMVIAAVVEEVESATKENGR